MTLDYAKIKSRKVLLMKEVCTRLPYGIKVHVKGEYKKAHKVESVDVEDGLVCWWAGMRLVQENVLNCSPYLRSMDTMTDAEKEEYKHLINKYNAANPESAAAMCDWLNAHYFDYNNLIDKGLAREAIEGMYDIK